ncbi:MurR/RpiR family transcriptional regulator [Klebsiella pasteurii]|uniref:MurR/RpiR family transcriptional regulator n=1 Tax=Klebsiella pasteurii TaxID=2587529 RepID=A0ABD5HKC5_9ENTR|nr:MurR/RpiR family transcriptional regulator [Klebsiella pasteurii]MBG2717670.1 MurR/RpiR family transcriptional regulator [Klebsiella michiganensis]MDS7910630.1 MurR/RpiR family transcriptional regulator [Klebsiella pasteurii]MDW2718702.1 MurR/RpiR family transcriptional regulator [Klebsiella pasteurii]PLL98994.1 MurR/RpiR family transcriptional regulator [Klebsiella michiganensis]VUS76175.1 HTH-type transcriptional regulator HexR [Klebsiella pasteurii]
MSHIDNNLLISIRNGASGLSPILEKVGRFITENPDFVMRHTISELADSIDTSEGSITRFCRAFGFKGFSDFRTALAMEQGAARSEDSASNESEEVASVLASIRDSNAIVDSQELKAAADWLNTLNSIAIYAVGTAVPVALFLQMNLINMGKAASFIDRSYPAAMPLLADSQKTGIIVVHSEQASADMMQALSLAKQQGVKILSLTRGTFAPLARLSDWNLQAAVALQGEGESGFAEIAGAMMVADRILSALEEQDERYAEYRKAHQKRIFSIESVANKLSEYFMS